MKSTGIVLTIVLLASAANSSLFESEGQAQRFSGLK